MRVFTYQAALLCETCGWKVREDLTAKGLAPEDPDDEYTYDSGDFPKGPFKDEPSDSPQHCDHCGIFLESPLTEDGLDYVQECIDEAISEGRADAVSLTVWAPFYGITSTTETCDHCGKQFPKLDAWGDGDIGDPSVDTFCSEACYRA